jgi:hypothetical protein
MEIRNDYNLAQGIYNKIVSLVYRPTKEKKRVSEIVGPPLIKTLSLDHWGELSCDASERIWSLLGTSVHYILEKDDDAITEVEVSAPFGDDIVVGHFDRYANRTIEDYKVTSVWSVINGLKVEWEQQLNIYRYLVMIDKKWPVDRLVINVIIRDWQKRKAEQDKDYPRIGASRIEVPVWDLEKTESFIRERLTDMRDNPMRECTPQEKWQRDTTYAVKKKNNKRAMRVFDTQKECVDYMTGKKINDSKDHFIETRLGECIRCQSYCQVRDVCPYNRK